MYAGPCSGKNLVTKEKRSGSFEYNLLPKLLTDFYHYMDGLKKPFEGPEFETMTSNQLKTPQNLPNLEKGGKIGN